MNKLKKYYPTIILLTVVGAAVSLLLIFQKCSNSETQDKDGDGFVDNVDKCPDVYSTKNSGCPEDTIRVNENDQDNDGFINFKNDPDDSDPCNPNENCLACDKDGDGLTLEQEKSKKTNPKKSDTDGDGVKDGQDNCPLQKGSPDNNGCPIDSDGDGIADNKDNCPEYGKNNSAYTKFNNRGCPVIDFNLQKKAGENKLTWDLCGYDGEIVLSISYPDLERPIEKRLQGFNEFIFDKLPTSINGRADVKVQISIRNKPPFLTILNDDLENQSGFKCIN